jgi:hypothetical protein
MTRSTPLLGLLASLVLYALFGHWFIQTLYTSDWLQDTIMRERAAIPLQVYHATADAIMLRVGVLGIALLALLLPAPTTRWLVIAGVFSLALILADYTTADAIMLRVGALGIALLALFLPAPTSRWLVIAGIFSLALLLFFWRLGEGSLHDTDEAIYAQISKEMIFSKVWITPHLNGVLFLQKPPLNFWLTALMYKLLGVNEFAARFCSAIFGLGTVLLIFFLGARFRSYAVGAAAALLLLISDHSYFAHGHNFLSLSRVGMLDSSLIFWVATALVLVWDADQHPWLIMLIGFPLGLAVMTKAWPGLFAIVLPFIYTLARKGRIDRVRYWIISLLLAGIVILPWHLWQLWVYGKMFFHEYFAVTLLGRLTGFVEEQEASPFFYLPVLREGFFLWEYFLPLAYVLAAWVAFKAKDRQAQFLLIWITVPLVLFSMAQTKLPWYVSLVYPAIALLIAVQMARLLGDRLASTAIVALMIFYIHVPVGADGSPSIKRFVASVQEYIEDPTKTIYVFNAECNRPPASIYEYNSPVYGQIRSSLLFYMNKPFECIDVGDLNTGRQFQDAYIIIDQDSMNRFGGRHFVRVGSAWFSGDEGDFNGVRGPNFVLAKLREPAPSGG